MPHAVTSTRHDLAMAALSPSGERLVVDATSLLRLIDALTQVDASSLGRLVLTDHNGAEVLLDRDRLHTRLGTVRLDQPFEWRAVRFAENGTEVCAEFQGTWIRQSMHELVLVSLVSGDVRESAHELKSAGLRPDAMLRRDVRLAGASRCVPPPFDQRVAVDRLFMLPLRRALDAAHFETRDSIPGGAAVE